MASYLNGILQSAYHYWEVGTFDPFVLKATPENLQKALQAKNEDVLKHTFHNNNTVYSILEYAVKLGDKSAVSTLAVLRADFNLSLQSHGTILFYYIDCLREGLKPDLALLNLLLHNVRDPNAEETSHFRTPLEYALERMTHFKKIHWNVIERLLQVCRITSNCGTTPFEVLRDSQSSKLQMDCRSEKEEMCFLNHLCEYVKLEKKYHPTTTSGLTLDEFKFHAHHLKATLSRAEIFMSVDNFMIGCFSSLPENLEQELAKQKDVTEDERKQVNEVVAFTQSTRAEMNRLKNQKLLVIWKKLQECHTLFQALVKGANFKDFFESWELSVTLSAFERASQHDSVLRVALLQFELWGLTDQKT